MNPRTESKPDLHRIYYAVDDECGEGGLNEGSGGECIGGIALSSARFNSRMIDSGAITTRVSLSLHLDHVFDQIRVRSVYLYWNVACLVLTCGLDRGVNTFSPEGRLFQGEPGKHTPLTVFR